jgi:transposase
MARYKNYNYSQTALIAVSLENQLIPGTIEHTIHEVVENKIDFSIFSEKYKNDDTGSPAYDPKLLVKTILLAYSRGINGSRRIEKACRENITFMALSCSMAPDHSTIASFVSSMDGEITRIFRDVLLYCEELNLLGGSHFSLDGCKLPSNASKEWSGTFNELRNKRNKLEKKVKKLINAHKREDACETSAEKINTQIQRITKKMEKIDRFLEENKPKQGKTTKEIQSNVTDNDSAKMPTSHGVIQGYNAQAISDGKYQIIVNAEAMGNGQDSDNLEPMIDGAKENMKAIGKGEDYFKGKQLSADANYHSNKNIKKCEDEKIDAYIPDINFRKRDERYENQERFKDGVTKRPKKNTNKHKSSKEIFSWEEFEPVILPTDTEKEQKKYKCPNGKYLDQQSLHHKLRNKVYEYYRAKESDCRGCPLRSKCLSKEKGKARGLLIPKGYRKDRNEHFTYSQQMQRKIDTEEGKLIYSERFWIIEPVFANIRYQKGLDRFTYRGKVKVNIQWMLYCLVHNIEKICNYGLAG